MMVVSSSESGVLSSRTHLPALDGLRGIAILLVFVYHSVFYSGWKPAQWFDRVLYIPSMIGWSGVDLFFVLSGFLITGILCDSKGGDHYLRNFYARRTLRIFPLYYAFLGLSFGVLSSFISPGVQLPLPVQEQVWFWSYLTNVGIVLRGWPPFEPFVHFWSLAVEEQFYLIWPWVVLVSTRRTLRLVCLGIIVGSLGLRMSLTTIGHPLAAFVLMPARMDALALGGLIAVVARGSDGVSRLARWAWPAVMASALLLGLIFLSRHTLGPTRDPVVQTVGFTLLAILSGGTLVIALAAPSESAAGRFFAHRFLRLLGRYSYGLYVFHVPIIRYAALFFGVGSTMRLAGSHLADQVAFTVFTAAVSLAAALCSWHLFEAPVLRLKAFFPYAARATCRRPHGFQPR